MSYGEQFQTAMSKHQQSLRALQDALGELNVDTLAEENIRLVDEISHVKKDFEGLKQNNQLLQKELGEIRQAYRDQILNEKMNHVQASKSRISELFRSKTQENMNRLQAIESSLTARIAQLMTVSEKHQDALGQKCSDELKRIQADMNRDVSLVRQRVEQEQQLIRDAGNQSYGDSELSEADDALVQTLKKRNNFEIKLGLNLINKLGVLLIFLAVVLAGRYTYAHWLGAYAKGILFYVLGLGFCGAGEWLHRKKMPTVAAGVIGGGIGLFYVSTFISTFYLKIMPFGVAMGISGLIAVTSLVLTLRYKSPTIGLLSLIGGYLPFFAYVVIQGLDNLPILQALAYLMVFNGVVLGISLKHKWMRIIYVGFLFNMPCIHFLLTRMNPVGPAILMAYINFAVYLAVILWRNLKDQEPLNTADLILLGINTLTNCSMVYYLFERGGFHDFDGLLALFYAGIYFGLAKATERRSGQRSMTNLFYGFAVAFSVLVVPLQLSKAWIFFGWLVEAALFVWFGRNNRIRPLEYMGNGLIILSHGAFLLWNGWILSGMHSNFWIYDAKYAALIGLEIFVVWVYWNAGKKYPDIPVPVIARQIREPIVAHLCLYLIYEVSKLYNNVMQVFGGTVVERFVLIWAVVVLFNEAGKRLKAERFIRFREYRWVTELLAYLLLMAINGIGLSDASGLRWVLDILLILLANTAIFWRMNRALMELQLYKRVTRETRSIVLALYGLSVYFINIMFRYTGNSESLILNLSLIAFALLYISLGFRNRLVTLRRAGLALALAGTAKMLIIDSLSFSLGQKIISYLIFGFVLIVISVVYQKLTARMLQDETGV